LTASGARRLSGERGGGRAFQMGDLAERESKPEQATQQEHLFAFAAHAAVFRMMAVPSQMFGAGGSSEKSLAAARRNLIKTFAQMRPRAFS
jgi:hypothetical protein